MKNLWKYMKEFAVEEDAVGVVEIILPIGDLESDAGR